MKTKPEYRIKVESPGWGRVNMSLADFRDNREEAITDARAASEKFRYGAWAVYEMVDSFPKPIARFIAGQAVKLQ